MKNFCFVLCILIFFIGCSDKRRYPLLPISSNDSLFVVDVDPIQEVEIKYFSDFFHSVHATILDDTPESLLGTISKMTVEDSLLITLDMDISKCVFVFDNKGNFIRKIGSVGNGPGEYLSVYDFTYDSANRCLMLLDTWSQRIHTYDLHTGKYTGSVRLRGDVDRLVRTYHICYQDSTFYADAYFDFLSPRNYLLRSFSDKGIQRSKHLKMSDYNRGWNNLYFIEKKVFYDFGENEGVLFNQQFMDTIIMIQNKRIFPYATLKSKRFITSQQLKKINKNHMNDFPLKELYDRDVIWGICNIVLHGDYLFFRYHDGYRIFQILYHQKTGAVSKVNFVNDVLYPKEFQEVVHQKHLYTDHKGLYFYIDLNDVPFLVAHARKGILRLPPEQVEKVKKLNENSNPVILYYEFKE